MPIETGGPIPGPVPELEGIGILGLCREMAPLMGIVRPASIFASTEQDSLEFQSIVNQVLNDIRDAHDWSKLTAVAVAIGDGLNPGFAMPEDFGRFCKNTQLWRANGGPIQQVGSVDDWMSLTYTNFQNTASSYWIYLGGLMQFSPALALNEQVSYPYQQDYGVLDAVDGVTPKFKYSADTDLSIFSDRLIKAGIIWRWKMAHGQDYTEELADFQSALGKDMVDDKAPGRIITSRGRTGSYTRSMGQHVF